MAVWTHNEHVFGMIRISPRGRMLVLANFTEQEQTVPGYRMAELGFDGSLVNHLNNQAVPGGQDLILQGYQAVWLSAKRN